ncbi:hypothetical protein B566_EDAN001943, partial [Ephemera danica]
MLKWFTTTTTAASASATNSQEPREVLTDDPLATLALSLPRVPGRRTARRAKPGHAAAAARAVLNHAVATSRPRHIYAVSRVNPIFEDDDGGVASSSTPETSSPDSGRRESSSPESPRGKSAGSSGYESNPTDRTSSSEFSDDLPGASPPSLRSSTQSEAGSPPRTCIPAIRRLGTRKRPALDIRDMEHHVAALSTIPEGQIPKESINNMAAYCIPAPIWPNGEQQQQQVDLVGRSELQAAARELSLQPTAVIPTPHEVRSLPQPPPGPPDITACAPRKYQRLRGIEAVKELWDKSGMRVNGCRRLLVDSDEDDFLSDTRRNCDTSMPPAQTIHPPPPPPPPPPLPAPSQCNETSSNSSGYSEISLITPPRRSVSPPILDLTSQLPPVFLHHDMSLVSNSVRNAMIYGTLCRIKNTSGGTGVIGYERLWNMSRSFDAARLMDSKSPRHANNVIDSPSSSSWESLPDVPSLPVKTFDKTAHYY